VTLVAEPMSDKKKPVEFCTYISTKIDDQVLPLVGAAASLEGMSVQDYLSDIANEAASRRLGYKPVKRRPTAPRKRPKPQS
jgi:hypothetical protein